MMTAIKHTTTPLALFGLSLTIAASTVFGHETISLEKRLAESLLEIQQEVQPEARESNRGKRKKKTQPQNADQAVETAAPAPDSEAQTAPAKPDKPRRQKPAKLSRRPVESAATPSPSPPAELSTTPFPEPTVDAMAPAASATPLLTSSSTFVIEPAGDDSILSLPVVLGLFALALIALILTVFMLMKQLRGSSKPGV
ncbi:MAG: hypothetical protein AB7U82_02495 [Blastocatellales bacterium]